MKQIALSEVEGDLSELLRLAADEEIVITRHGKPAGVSLALRRRMTGSTTVWRTIPGFSQQRTGSVKVTAQVWAPGLRM